MALRQAIGRSVGMALIVSLGGLGPAEAAAGNGPQIDDLSSLDIAFHAAPGVCATGYRRAYAFKATPDDAPLVFVDRDNSALIRIDGRLIELKSVAHLSRVKSRTRSFADPVSDITVEQTFKTEKENRGILKIPVLRGSIKITSKAQTTTIWVVGKPGC